MRQGLKKTLANKCGQTKSDTVTLVTLSDPSKILGIDIAYSVQVDTQAAADQCEAALSTVASGGESVILTFLGLLKANTPGGGFAGETQLKLSYDFLLLILSGETVSGRTLLHTCVFVCISVAVVAERCA